MDFYFSTVKKPVATLRVALRTVYRVFADPTYDVRKKGGFEDSCVALRTTGGRGCVKIEGTEEMSVLPGSLLLFRHNDVRRYYCGDETWDFWWFEFDAGEIPDISLNRVFEISAADSEESDSKACLEYLGKSGAASLALASAYFDLLLHKWLLHFENKISGDPHRAAINQSIDYIKKNISKNLKVKSIANTAGFCERRFRQIFTEVVGMQPKKYIDILRINLSAELLENTSFPVSEISDKLGYSSQFHFSRAFQKMKGMSPSQFRKR